MEDINATATTPKANNSKKIIIVTIGLLLVILGSYFAYQNYLTRQYVEKIMPLHRTLTSLSQDQEKVSSESDGKLYKDLISESDRIKKSAQDLKLRFIEIDPPTDKAREINKSFTEATDKLISWSEASGNYLQNDLSLLQAKKMLSYLYDQSRTPYVGSYFYNELDKQEKNVKDLKTTNEEAKIKNDTARAAFLSGAKYTLDNLLGVAAEKQ